jgi:hypothetical protein
MTGTETQIEWGAKLKLRVGTEFDRVSRVFQTVCDKQREPDRAETEAIIAMVGEMRSTVMANDDAGYYIREWQDLKNQVRDMVSQDQRYKAIRANRELRKSKKG